MFKEILIDLMQGNGLSQRELARNTDIPPTTISGWLNSNRLPDYIAIKKLSTFFDISADYLIGAADEWGNRGEEMRKPAEISDDKRKVLKLYDELSPERKREAIVWLKTMRNLDAEQQSDIDTPNRLG